MIYFVLRHKATNKLFPMFKSNKGYTHWEPQGERNFNELDTPRLFRRAQDAKVAARVWSWGPQVVIKGSGFGSFCDDPDDRLVVEKPERPRSIDDLEVVQCQLILQYVDAR